MKNDVNNQAFIDGQNLYIGTTHSKSAWHVDIMRFRIYLKEKYHVKEAYYFIGAFDPENQDLYNSLQKNGYVVVFREYIENSISHKKGNVDTDIVFSIMRKLADNEDFDKILLVSGDGDYWRMVDYLIKKNKFEKLLVPNKNNLSSLYRQRTPDAFRAYLDDPAVKKKIKYRKK